MNKEKDKHITLPSLEDLMEVAITKFRGQELTNVRIVGVEMDVYVSRYVVYDTIEEAQKQVGARRLALHLIDNTSLTPDQLQDAYLLGEPDNNWEDVFCTISKLILLEELWLNHPEIVEEERKRQDKLENSSLKIADGIDIAADLESHPEWTPRVSEQDIDEAGAKYTYLEISYSVGDDVRATRNVAKILPGNRTEIAYWTEAAPTKSLTVHRGKGRLIVGDPNSGTVEEISLNYEDTEKVTLPSGRFYTIQAEVNGIEPLMISGFYQPPPDWEGLEISVKPGKDHVKAKEGIKKIPSDFNAMLNV